MCLLAQWRTAARRPVFAKGARPWTDDSSDDATCFDLVIADPDLPLTIRVCLVSARQNVACCCRRRSSACRHNLGRRLTGAAISPARLIACRRSRTTWHPYAETSPETHVVTSRPNAVARSKGAQNETCSPTQGGRSLLLSSSQGAFGQSVTPFHRACLLRSAAELSSWVFSRGRAQTEPDQPASCHGTRSMM
jgi:hypothetical protein